VKRLCLALLVVTLAGCAQPASGIAAAFRSLLRSVEQGDIAKVEQVAPFLSSLAPEQKDAVLRSLRSLSGQTLELAVSAGSGGTWVLRVSRQGSPPLLVPFRRGSGGRWQMSPVLEQTQHIDVVPARR
jgi:hypothetical protein